LTPWHVNSEANTAQIGKFDPLAYAEKTENQNMVVQLLNLVPAYPNYISGQGPKHDAMTRQFFPVLIRPGMILV
jgi:hypothetical protein